MSTIPALLSSSTCYPPVPGSETQEFQSLAPDLFSLRVRARGAACRADERSVIRQFEAMLAEYASLFRPTDISLFAAVSRAGLSQKYACIFNTLRFFGISSKGCGTAADCAHHASAQPSRRGSEPASSTAFPWPSSARRMISTLHGHSRSPTGFTG